MTEELEASERAPRANPALFGHENAEALLLRAAASDRLPHAWLISGPRGLGKATLAFRFARYLLKKPASEDEGGGLFGDALPAMEHDDSSGLAMDPEDPVFRRVAQESHPDLFTVTRRVNDRGRLPLVISVEEVRKATAFLRMTPAEAGWRVVVVDAADEMNSNAANALLKSLEEPPERAVLLLVSHQPGRLLPTIRSRCCHLPLSPLSPSDMAKFFAAQLPEALNSDEGELLTALADGCPGQAVALWQAEGCGLFRDAVTLLEAFPAIDAAAVHVLAEKLARGGDSSAFRTTLDLLQSWLGRVARHASGAASDSQELWPGEHGLLSRLVEAKPAAHWLKAWHHVGAIVAATESSYLDRKQAVLSAFLALETSPTWE